MADYQRMASELRSAGIAAELYLGSKGFRQQLKYADKRDSPVAVIAGGNEFERGEVTLKDLRLGAKLSSPGFSGVAPVARQTQRFVGV